MQNKDSQKIKLMISYDGTDYFGWQRQTTTEKTVQGQIERALSELLCVPTEITGAGRTDAGVHAVAQVAHFTAPHSLERYQLVRALNTKLPDGIAITQAFTAPAEFHARFSAVSKSYRYVIRNAPVPSALRHRFCAWVPRELNPEELNQISQPLRGEHDFESFQTKGSEVKSTVRHITELYWSSPEPGFIELQISGTGFLKQMVRNIAGTVVQLAHNGRSAADMEAILRAQDRSQALTTAPPQGLFLQRVFYPPELDNQCREI